MGVPESVLISGYCQEEHQTEGWKPSFDAPNIYNAIKQEEIGKNLSNKECDLQEIIRRVDNLLCEKFSNDDECISNDEEKIDFYQVLVDDDERIYGAFIKELLDENLSDDESLSEVNTEVCKDCLPYCKYWTPILKEHHDFMQKLLSEDAKTSDIVDSKLEGYDRLSEDLAVV